MDTLENLVKTTLAEIEKILNSKTVMGEPITIEDSTIIPLTKVGFGFGIGSGSGKAKEKEEGAGGGIGGGGGVRPVAMIIVNKDGVKIEPVTNKTSVLEKLGETIPQIIDKVGQKKAEAKQEG